MVRPEPHASFEPPRAGPLRGAWNAWFTFRRKTRLRIPRNPVTLGVPDFSSRTAAVLLFPIYAWVVLGKPARARWAAVAYAVSMLVALICVGWSAAGYAAGVMITLHGLGIAEYFSSSSFTEKLRYRFARTAGSILVVAIAYTVISRSLLNRFVLPVQTNHAVVLINRWALTPAKPEEIVAFRTAAWRAGNTRIPAGVYLARVFASAGDVVSFADESFSVNGTSQPRRPFMPKSGTISIPPGNSFLWPIELTAEYREQEQALNFARTIAVRPDAEIVGQPYSWWFWRSTSL